jgi:hypothetical protein
MIVSEESRHLRALLLHRRCVHRQGSVQEAMPEGEMRMQLSFWTETRRKKSGVLLVLAFAVGELCSQVYYPLQMV